MLSLSSYCMTVVSQYVLHIECVILACECLVLHVTILLYKEACSPPLLITGTQHAHASTRSSSQVRSTLSVRMHYCSAILSVYSTVPLALNAQKQFKLAAINSPGLECSEAIQELLAPLKQCEFTKATIEPTANDFLVWCNLCRQNVFTNCLFSHNLRQRPPPGTTPPDVDVAVPPNPLHVYVYE